MASRRRMHPVAEAALGIAAQVGQKAAKRAAGAALDAVTQSVLEDVGDVGDKAKAVRQAIRGEPISAVVVEDEEGEEGAAMPRRKRRVEEEEDIDLEDEDEEGDYGEVDDDDDDDEEEEARPRKMDDEEFIERLEDAETLTKLALSILEECVKRKTFPRRTFKLLERAHDEIEDRLEEIS